MDFNKYRQSNVQMKTVICEESVVSHMYLRQNILLVISLQFRAVKAALVFATILSLLPLFLLLQLFDPLLLRQLLNKLLQPTKSLHLLHSHLEAGYKYIMTQP